MKPLEDEWLQLGVVPVEVEAGVDTSEHPEEFREGDIVSTRDLPNALTARGWFLTIEADKPRLPFFVVKYPIDFLHGQRLVLLSLVNGAFPEPLAHLCGFRELVMPKTSALDPARGLVQSDPSGLMGVPRFPIVQIQNVLDEVQMGLDGGHRTDELMKGLSSVRPIPARGWVQVRQPMREEVARRRRPRILDLREAVRFSRCNGFHWVPQFIFARRGRFCGTSRLRTRQSLGVD